MTNFFSYVFDIPTLTQLLIMPMTGLGYVFVNQYSSYSSLLNCLFFGSIDGVLHVQYLDKTYLLVFQKLFMNYCHKLTHSWIFCSGWRKLHLTRGTLTFLGSNQGLLPSLGINRLSSTFLVRLAIRWEGMWTAPEKVARPHISHHLIGRIERTGMSS